MSSQKKKEAITLDFETEEILSRPSYPPKPVGVSIKFPGEKKATYYAWGHPSENNTDLRNAKRKLQEVWKSKFPVIMHHAKFDLDVAETYFGLPSLPWERVHDTMYLLFLADPHARSLELKPAAERLLGMKPEERDAVKDWLVEHKIVRAADKRWGRFISKAPGDVVGKYANGDTLRTERLFNHLYDDISQRGMLRAYQRECELMPLLLENERAGIRVDMEGLERDIVLYGKLKLKTEEWLRKRLKAPVLNIDSVDELAEVLNKRRIVTDWVLTPTGQRSTAKDNLTPDKFKDPQVASALGYHGRLSTCLGTFMEPWLAMARETGGTINTTWNQVRQTKDGSGKMKGTRTGRPSTNNPNFLNIPKTFDDKDDGYVHPGFLRVDPLPLVRRYCLPDRGQRWLHRDFNQQELRILAHFENKKLRTAYRENPDLDIHSYVKSEIKRIAGLEIERRKIKILNFGKIYGEGLGSMADRLSCSREEVKRIRDAQNKALPGLPDLEREIKHLGRKGECIVTWAGREYYVEPPIEFGGRMITFEYKLLNYLIQGSAADCTKEAVIRYHKMKKHGRFLVTVYDEINISAPVKAEKTEMKLLREAMEGIEFDVPMLSEGKSGLNWGNLKETKEKR